MAVNRAQWVRTGFPTDPSSPSNNRVFGSFSERISDLWWATPHKPRWVASVRLALACSIPQPLVQRVPSPVPSASASPCPLPMTAADVSASQPAPKDKVYTVREALQLDTAAEGGLTEVCPMVWCVMPPSAAQHSERVHPP